MNVDAYALRGANLSAVETILLMMETGVAVGDTLDEGPSSTVGVERYAREVCEANPRSDLGILYGLAMVAVGIATQGGIVLECPIAGGGWLKVPPLNHFIGVAPSGWRKSTALTIAQAPLDRALAAGERDRRTRVMQLLAAAKRDVNRDHRGQADFLLEDKQFAYVFNGGVCPDTLVKDPTVESLRNMAVYNGGCVGALAGEADIFRNLTQYSSNGQASLTFFLDLWDQSTIATARVGAGMLKMEDAALYLGVLFQTDVFAEVTSGGGGGRGGGTGADSFLSRGMFGRIWVVETEQTSGFADIAATYADDAVHEFTGPDGHAGPGGEVTPLGAALIDYEKILTGLVADTNEYRLHKALDHSWKAAAAKHGADLQVPEIVALPQETLRLSRDAQRAYNRVQRMYNALEEGLAEMDEDAQTMWGPLVSRFVQHVMREALLVTLAAGGREVTAETIEDAACRLIPWRWALTTKALSRRTVERVEDILQAAAMDNPRAEDRTPAGRVLTVLAKMAREDPETRRSGGWGRREITRKVTSTLNRQQRKNVAAVVHAALEQLCGDQDGTPCVRKVSAGVNPVNRLPVWKYTIEEWAVY